MGELYPSPPHLMVALYCDRPEVETFALLHETVAEFGCRPTGAVNVAPADEEFEALSDLETRETLKVDPARYSQLVSGRDPKLRVLKAGCVHAEFGTVIVEYLARFGPGSHPVAVSMYADSIGIPVSLWSAQDRDAACLRTAWTQAFLEAASTRCDALYGAIGVEFSLPVPWEIRTDEPSIPADLFVSYRLLGRGGEVEADLRRAYAGDEVRTWENGLYFSAWRPFHSEVAFDLNDEAMHHIAAVSDAALTALRSALSNY